MFKTIRSTIFQCSFWSVTLISLAANAQKLKEKTYYLDDKNFKNVLYDSLGRPTLSWEQKVKKLPCETRNYVTYREYTNDGLGTVDKTFNGKISRKGLLYFPPKEVPRGDLIFWNYDTLEKRTDFRVDYFVLGIDYQPMPLKQAWVEPISITSSSISSTWVYENELVDSTEFQSTYCFFNGYSKGEVLSYYDKNKMLISKKRSSIDRFYRASQHTTLFTKEYERHITCYQWRTKTDICMTRDTYYKENSIIKKVYYHNIKGQKVNELDLKKNYTVEYFYPHPTIEKQIVKTAKKSFEITIRKKYWP